MKRENSPGPIPNKEAIRRKMRATLRSLAPDLRARASLELCRRAAALPPFREAKVLALFAPLPSEPDIHPLIEEAWARGKRIVFPLMLREGEVAHLQWHEVMNWEEMIVAGPFGLREPDPVRCPSVQADEIDFVLAPGLAFDARGGRLGRGGGYYDSALADLSPRTPRIGIMFVCQEVPEVPREPHDQLLENVLTENGLVI